jgi:hypothetical protein
MDQNIGTIALRADETAIINIEKAEFLLDPLFVETSAFSRSVLLR